MSLSTSILSQFHTSTPPPPFRVRRVSFQTLNPKNPADAIAQQVLSLELQLFRQARLVELLLDVIQTHDPQFTSDQRDDITSAFADAGSIPELLSRKLKTM